MELREIANAINITAEYPPELDAVYAALPTDDQCIGPGNLR